MINRVIGISTLAIIIILYAAFVFASTVILPTPDSAIDQADIIATGKVRSITSYETDEGLKTQIEIDTTDTIKGLPQKTLIVREMGGKVGDKFVWISGSPQYKVGDKVTVMLKAQHDGSYRTFLLDNGRIPEKTGVTANALFGQVPSFKEKVNNKIMVRRKELKQSQPFTFSSSRVQPLPLNGPAESLESFTPAQVNNVNYKYMTTPPSKWVLNPVSVYGDPVGDVKHGPVKSREAVIGATESWSSAGNVTFQYSGDTPAVGYTCVQDRLLVQFRDVKNDITDPVQCSGVLAIGGFCGGFGPTRSTIQAGAVVFNNGWENCSFWSVSNITEVMTHEIGHAIGLGHSAESGESTTQLTSDATMYAIAHFDGRANGIKEYDRGAIANLYGSSNQPTPTVSSTPTPRPSATPTPTPVPTKTTSGPFYDLSSLEMKSVTGKTSAGYVSVRVITNEPILKEKPQFIIFNNETRASGYFDKLLNVQLNNNVLSFRTTGIPVGLVGPRTSVAVVTGSKLAFKDLSCVLKPDKYTVTYTCQ